MIISKHTNPDNDLYVVGAHIIEELNKINVKTIDFLTLHERVAKGRKVSIQLYSLSLSWLFVLGTIDKTSQGDIIKCF